jgi:formamidopyrimidine-DNA glycosylase
VPELPEVETVRRGLAPVLVGRQIIAARALRPDLRFPFPERFAARLTAARAEALLRRGKYLIAPLDTGETLMAHLGMSGRFTVIVPEGERRPGDFYYANPPDPTHTHVVLEIEGGARIEYNDPRRFGFMDLLPAAWEGAPPFAAMGPEPLGNSFSGAYLAAAFEGRSQSVKASLLDQRLVAGLGNIYVCEALHRTGISPKRAAGRIAAARLEALATAIRAVLTEAIEAGGSSLRDYAQADGALGYFQHGFRVYDREGQACPTPDCGGTVRRMVQAGRSTFYCPSCQR